MTDSTSLIWLDGATGTIGRAVQARLEADGYQVLPLPRDLELLPELMRQHGSPSGLVCMSGSNHNQLLARTKEEDWRSLLQANLLHQSEIIRFILPELMQRQEASIVLCSSLAARHPRSGQVAYAATKGAVESFTRGLAREIGAKNIRVNAVAPGFIDSTMFTELSEKEQAAILAKIPLGRTGKPEEIAATVAFLVSERSRYITGQTLKIDGGVS